MDDATRKRLRGLLGSAQALLDSMNATQHSDDDNIWRFLGYRSYLRKYNELARLVASVTPIDTVLDYYDLDKVPGNCDTLPVQQRDLFQQAHANLSILRAFLENKIGIKHDQIHALQDFLQSKLRRVVFTKPEKEVEVQNAVEQLLIGRGFQKGIDYDREVGRVKVSIKEVVPDFVMLKLDMAVEIKLCKDAAKSRAIVDEINADIGSYSKRYSTILFVVYDLGAIRDDSEFKRDLERADGVSLVIVKH